MISESVMITNPKWFLYIVIIASIVSIIESNNDEIILKDASRFFETPEQFGKEITSQSPFHSLIESNTPKTKRKLSNIWKSVSSPIGDIQNAATEEASRLIDAGFNDKITLSISCFHLFDDGIQYSCESVDFSKLEFDSCEIELNYVYIITNNLNEKVRLDALLDESFRDVLSQTARGIIDMDSTKEIQSKDVLDICQGNSAESEVTKKAVAIAHPLDGTNAPFASAVIQIKIPILPFQLRLDRVSCEINDGSEIDCNSFLISTTSASKNQCSVDIKFNYKFTNIGLACVDIMSITAQLGPLQIQALDFSDIYSFRDRSICNGDTWTVPDRRLSINLCEMTAKPTYHHWSIAINVEEYNGRRKVLKTKYDWTYSQSVFIPLTPSNSPVLKTSFSPSPSGTKSVASLSSRPSIPPSALPTESPSDEPTASPTIDTCKTCTLTSFMSGVSRILVWGHGKESVSFQGVCDIIAIENDLMQLQIQYRPGRRTPQWSGLTQIALKWKPTDEILFHFEGDRRLIVDNTNSRKGIVEYSSRPSAMQGRKIHRFQFAGTTEDNFIQIEELPYGLHNIEVKGFGGTFGSSNGMLGSWDRWNTDPRITLRGGEEYRGFDGFKLAKSWAVLGSESFLNNPSDICAAEYDCGPGEDIECVDDLYGFHDSRSKNRDADISSECTATCDDIENPHMRLFCKEDEKLTNFSFWACQNAFNQPIITESKPPACPTDCSGDVTKERFSIAGIDSNQSCIWAIRDPKRVEQRCGYPEVAMNCCESCCTSCRGDAAGKDKFDIPGIGKRTCEWAAREDSKERCSNPLVLRMCCETCAKAVPSEQPSSFPTLKPSSIPTHIPSELPTDSPSLTSSVLPSSRHSNSPSAKTSRIPSLLPSLVPSKNTLSPITSTSPTILASVTPTAFSTCIMEELVGKTITFSHLNVCWKVEMFESGVIAADLSDKNCTHKNFLTSGVISIFDYALESKLYFKKGGIGWSGCIQIKESLLVTDVTLGATSWDESILEYAIEIILPSCNSLSISPSFATSEGPSLMPSLNPSTIPSLRTSLKPSLTVSTIPTFVPSNLPILDPSSKPTDDPSSKPTVGPSNSPTLKPSNKPTGEPSNKPTDNSSSWGPVNGPTYWSTYWPTKKPSSKPSRKSSAVPSSQLSSAPISTPSSDPSLKPSGRPSDVPSSEPSNVPSLAPSSDPSSKPSSKPSVVPSPQQSSAQPLNILKGIPASTDQSSCVSYDSYAAATDGNLYNRVMGDKCGNVQHLVYDLGSEKKASEFKYKYCSLPGFSNGAVKEFTLSVMNASDYWDIVLSGTIPEDMGDKLGQELTFSFPPTQSRLWKFSGLTNHGNDAYIWTCEIELNTLNTPFPRILGTDYSFQKGTSSEGTTVRNLGHNDYMVYSSVNFGPSDTTKGMLLKYAKGNDDGGQIEIRLGSGIEGQLIAEFSPAPIRDHKRGLIWTSSLIVCLDLIDNVDGVQTITILGKNASEVMNLEWFELTYFSERSSVGSHISATAYSAQFGIQFATSKRSEGSELVAGWFDNNDFVTYTNVNFGQTDTTKIIKVRYSKASNGGKVEVRLGGPNGTLISTFIPRHTDGWNYFVEGYIDISTVVNGVNEVTFVGKDESEVWNLEYFEISER